MRLRVIALMALLAASLIVLAAAQTNYAGQAKVVMKLTKMPEMPAAQNEASGLVPTTYGFATPDVPQGSMLQGEVLYSSDPAIKANQTYSLYVNYDPNNEPYGFQAGLVDKLKSGAVVGINDYTLQGSQVTVKVNKTDDWAKKISVLDSQYTDPNETKNPFMISLDGFRQFGSFPTFNTTTTKPMMNMSFDWGASQFSSPSFGTKFSSLFNSLGHMFD